MIPGTDDDSFAVWFFEVAGEMIWGATARMIHELLSVVLTGTNGSLSGQPPALRWAAKGSASSPSGPKAT